MLDVISIYVNIVTIAPGLPYNIYSEHIMRCVLEEHHYGITIGGR